MKKKGPSIFLVVAFFVAVALPCGPARSLDENGPQTRQSLVVHGETLKLIGSGLREFLFIDIYAMSAYSRSGRCDVQSIIYRDEIKYLRIEILREISKDRMVSTLKDTLTQNLPENPDEELKRNINSFLSNFSEDLKQGTIVEIIYVPGTGTLLKQNGRQLGAPTEGKGFSETLWKSYFGSDTCCSGLKSSILEQCNK